LLGSAAGTAKPITPPKNEHDGEQRDAGSKAVSTDPATTCAFGRSLRPFELDRQSYEDEARRVFERYGMPYSNHRG
jgi:hypothetical protein